MPWTHRAGSRRGWQPLLVAFVLLAAVAAAGCLPSGSRGGGSGSAGSSGQTAVTITPGPTGPTPRPTIVPPTPTPAPTFLVHVVAKGESLNTIAHRYGTSARSIAFWNRTTYPSLDPEAPGYRPDLLKVGWTLFLIPNLILSDDEAPPLPTTDASGEPAATQESAASDGSEP